MITIGNIKQVTRYEIHPYTDGFANIARGVNIKPVKIRPAKTTRTANIRYVANENVNINDRWLEIEFEAYGETGRSHILISVLESFSICYGSAVTRVVESESMYFDYMTMRDSHSTQTILNAGFVANGELKGGALAHALRNIFCELFWTRDIFELIKRYFPQYALNMAYAAFEEFICNNDEKNARLAVERGANFSWTAPDNSEKRRKRSMANVLVSAIERDPSNAAADLILKFAPNNAGLVRRTVQKAFETLVAHRHWRSDEDGVNKCAWCFNHGARMVHGIFSHISNNDKLVALVLENGYMIDKHLGADMFGPPDHACWCSNALAAYATKHRSDMIDKIRKCDKIDVIKKKAETAIDENAARVLVSLLAEIELASV